MYKSYLLVPAHNLSRPDRKRICVLAAVRRVYLAVHGESILVPLSIGAERAQRYADRITALNNTVK